MFFWLASQSLSGDTAIVYAGHVWRAVYLNKLHSGFWAITPFHEYHYRNILLMPGAYMLENSDQKMC